MPVRASHVATAPQSMPVLRTEDSHDSCPVSLPHVTSSPSGMSCDGRHAASGFPRTTYRNPIMRFLTVAAILTTTTLTAQSPLTTTFANNNGNGNGGMVFFDLDVTSPIGIQIFAMDINTSSAAGTIDVYTTPSTWVGKEANASLWTMASTGNFDGAGVGFATEVCMAPGFYLPQGQYGIAIAQDATTSQAYTTGTPPFQLVYSTTDLSLTAGASNNAHFSGAPFSPRVWNGSIYYNLGPVLGSCPSKTLYGVGCNREFASFYELMDTAAFDLTNTDMTATKTASGYVIVTSAGTGPLSVGLVDPAGGTVLSLGDDNAVPAGTLGMQVGSNGWFAKGAGNSTSFAPTVATMLGNPSEGIYAWTDLQPNTSGVTTYEEDVATGQTRVTMDGVLAWNTPDPVHLQFDYNVISGDWAIRIGVVGFANPEDWLVGHSVAGPSLDPGGIDISAAGVVVTSSQDVLPLTLDGSPPRLNLPWDLTTTNIDQASPWVLTLIGTRGPAIPMTSVGFNSPGCDINLATVIDSRLGNNSSGSATVSFLMPTCCADDQISAQSVAYTLTNPSGLLSSNGIEGTLGN